MIYRGDEKNKKDHECLLDEKTYRCKICGRSLKWTIYGIVRDTDPFEQRMKRLYIDYFKYESMLNRINKQNEIIQMSSQQKIFSIRNFTQFQNASQMRDFVYFILCLPLSYGFSNQIQAYRDRNSFKFRERSINNFQSITALQQTYTQLDKLAQNTAQPQSHQANLNKDNQSSGQLSHRRSIVNVVNDKKILPPVSIRELQLEGDQPPDFEFFGDFEGANFLHAFYDPKNLKVQIILKADTNTDGFTSWFYFGVKVKTNESLRLNFEILNCRKEKSLFQSGMNVSIAKLNDNIVYNNFTNYLRLWRRDMAFDIKYEESTYPRKVFKRSSSLRVLPVNDFVEVDNTFIPENQQIEEKCTKLIELSKKGVDINNERDRFYNQKLRDKKFIKNYYHGLSFVYQFPTNPKDTTILFAQNIPYTFSNMIEFIENIEATIKQQNPLFRYSFNNDTRIYTIDTFNLLYEKTIIGASNIGLPITELQITAPNSQRALNMQKRPYIFIIARQHPNETPGSFVCQGLIKFLTSSEPEALSLRQMFIFKVIPMVNPDGVAIGNSRSSIKGVDLNRSWEQSDDQNFPEINCIKQRIQQLTDSNRSVYMFLDLHGHTTKSGSFLLCTLKEDASNLEWTKVRLFPKIIAENCKFFDISSCKYSFLPTEKSCCAREVAWRDLKVEHSYTLETSFFGSKNVFQGYTMGEDLIFDPEDQTVKHFTVPDYEYIGQQVCKSILQFSACITLMIQQAMINEKTDINEEELLTGQVPVGFEIPQEELIKLQDISLQKKLASNLSNVSGDNSLITSQQLSRAQSKDGQTPKTKKNMKTASVAISQMLRLKQMLDEKEKAKDGYLFSDQRVGSNKNSNHGSRIDLFEPEDFQQAINRQNEEDDYQINYNADPMTASISKIMDSNPKKVIDDKKPPYFLLGGQTQQQITQKTVQTQSSNTSKSQEKSNALSKFQQYVLKTQEQIKVLFALKKGLDWNKFYDKNDAEELQNFKDQQQQAKEAKAAKQSYNLIGTQQKINLDTETNSKMAEHQLTEQNNESDSEPEDDCIKKYKRRGKNGEWLDIDVDNENLNSTGRRNSTLTSSQKRLLEQSDEDASKENLKSKATASLDSIENSDINSQKLGGKQYKRNQNQLSGDGEGGSQSNFISIDNQDYDANKQKSLYGLNFSTQGDEEAERQGQNKDKYSQSSHRILLPTTKYIFGQPYLSKPFTEKIKLKSPFLPSQEEIFEAYSIKSPLNLKNLELKKQLTENNSHQNIFSQISIPTHIHPSSFQTIQQTLVSEKQQGQQQIEGEEDEKFIFRQAESSRVLFGTLQTHEMIQTQTQISKNPLLIPQILPLPSQKRMTSISENLFIPYSQQQSDNYLLSSSDTKTNHFLPPDQLKHIDNSPEDHIQQSNEKDYIVEQSSSSSSPKQNLKLRLDLRSLSNQKDYSLNKANRITNTKDGMQCSKSIQSPLSNSIYGGLIAALQQDPNNHSQKPNTRHHSMLMKLSVPSNLNSPTLTSNSSKTFVAYRPLSGQIQNSQRSQKDMFSPSSTTTKQQMDIQFLKLDDQTSNITNSYYQSSSIPNSPTQNIKQLNQNSSQPSFRIKQNNVNKAYKTFLEQQQTKLLKEQTLQQQQSQNIQIKQPSTSQGLVRNSPSSLQSRKSSNAMRNSSNQGNLLKSSFSQNS